MEFQSLSRRHDGQISSDVTNKLLIVFLVLLMVCILSAGALYFFRRHTRKQQKNILPYHEKDGKLAPKRSNHRRVSGGTISSTASFSHRSPGPVLVESEKDIIDRRASTTSTKNLPEIHITFPEEVDHNGKRQSGRVVVVDVGEKGVLGLAPADEALPPYSAGNFVSLDLDRIGGLKEKGLFEEARP